MRLCRSEETPFRNGTLKSLSLIHISKAYVYVTGIGNYAGSTKFEGSDVTYTKAQDFAIEGWLPDSLKELPGRHFIRIRCNSTPIL